MKNTTSWIKLHRQLTNWEWYTDSKMVHLFLHLLLNANYKKTKWRGQTIKPGQILTGRKQLSEATGMSEQSIRTCLKNLEATSEITIKSTNKFSVITIVNFDKYQQTKEEVTSKLTNKLTNNQPASNHIQESKERKEDNVGSVFEQWANDLDLDVFKVKAEARKAYLHYQNQDFKTSQGNPIQDIALHILKYWKPFNNPNNFEKDSIIVKDNSPVN